MYHETSIHACILISSTNNIACGWSMCICAASCYEHLKQMVTSDLKHLWCHDSGHQMTAELSSLVCVLVRYPLAQININI